MKTKSRTSKKTSAKKKTPKKKNVSKKSATKSSNKETLEDIFEDLLKDIYWAEKHLVKALPKLAKASFNKELQQAFDSHLKETHGQVARIEKCFASLNKKAQAKKCDAMQGLLEEGTEVIKDHKKSHARDAALIAAAQKVEHYEISAYGTLRTMAHALDKSECARLLEETKDEEASADETLTRVADKINVMAIQN